MSECDYDNKQSEPRDDWLNDKQMVAKWLREVDKGHEAKMKILKYLLKKKKVGLLVDEGTLSTGDEVTPSTGASVTSGGVHVGVVHNRIADQPAQSSNKNHKIAALEIAPGTLQSIKTSPILRIREDVPLPAARKTKSSYSKQQLKPLDEDGKVDIFIKRDGVLFPRASNRGQRNWVREQKDNNLKADFHAGEDSNYSFSSSSQALQEIQPLLESDVPERRLTDESSDVQPGRRFAKLRYDGEQSPHLGLNSGGIFSPRKVI